MQTVSVTINKSKITELINRTLFTKHRAKILYFKTKNHNANCKHLCVDTRFHQFKLLITTIQKKGGCRCISVQTMKIVNGHHSDVYHLKFFHSYRSQKFSKISLFLAFNNRLCRINTRIV